MVFEIVHNLLAIIVVDVRDCLPEIVFVADVSFGRYPGSGYERWVPEVLSSSIKQAVLSREEVRPFRMPSGGIENQHATSLLNTVQI